MVGSLSISLNVCLLPTHCPLIPHSLPFSALSIQLTPLLCWPWSQAHCSVMEALVTAIVERLKIEMSYKRKHGLDAKECWLLQLLADNSFWIRAGQVVLRQGKLHAYAGARSPRMRTFDTFKPGPDVFYLRDLFVWLPSIMFGETPLQCPSCESDAHVKVHNFTPKARRSISLYVQRVTVFMPTHVMRVCVHSLARCEQVCSCVTVSIPMHACA